MQNLKQEYNQTLKRYYNGCNYLMNNPNEWERYEKVILELLDELNKIIQKIGNMTSNEILEGFIIE